MEATDRNLMGPAGPELLGQLLDRHGPALELYRLDGDTAVLEAGGGPEYTRPREYRLKLAD